MGTEEKRRLGKEEGKEDEGRGEGEQEMEMQRAARSVLLKRFVLEFIGAPCLYVENIGRYARRRTGRVKSRHDSSGERKMHALSNVRGSSG